MVKAYQVPWDIQDSMFGSEEWYLENVAIFGNKDFRGCICPAVERAKSVMDDEDLLGFIEDHIGKPKYQWYYGNLTEYMMDVAPPFHKEKYSTKDISIIKETILGYTDSIDEDDALVALLEVMTGEEWKCTIIRGCCQRDWNKLYYPKSFKDCVKDIERRYFNTGSEWRIEQEGEYDYYHYTTAWDNDEIRSEIADVACVPVEDVQMFEFSGYRQEATYNEI